MKKRTAGIIKTVIIGVICVGIVVGEDACTDG